MSITYALKKKRLEIQYGCQVFRCVPYIILYYNVRKNNVFITNN